MKKTSGESVSSGVGDIELVQTKDGVATGSLSKTNTGKAKK